MEQPGTSPDTPDVTLDNLVGLVEKAARIVEYLQKENVLLADDLKDHQVALQSAAVKAAMQEARIQALEGEAQQLRHDAQYWQWFYEKYHNSTFFNHIEREYATDHAHSVTDSERNGDAIAA